MTPISLLLKAMQAGDTRALARAITCVENELEGYEELLTSLTFPKPVPVIGITGPPGAGKSTLISMLIKASLEEGKKVGIVAVDPTSPFTNGSLLGDRLRMAEHFTNEQVFIRSLATRGALGGLSAKSIEVTDVMRSFGFDLLILETVGVGQSEVEIAGLADISILVLVPEAGDEVQTLKAGIMEIADIFVVNKSDRDGADLFVKNLLSLVASKHDLDIPVIKTSATKGEGMNELKEAIFKQWGARTKSKRKLLLTEKVYRLLAEVRMRGVSKPLLEKLLQNEIEKPDFNIYRFVKDFPDPPPSS